MCRGRRLAKTIQLAVQLQDQDTCVSEFYRAFEDKHRGSRELILERLAVYLPYIEKIRECWDLEITDLGCGRGEWLELLNSLEVRCHGVDLDEEMLASCRSRGLTVSRSDAIGYLKQLPTASQMAISAFHLVEHIPFDQLKVLVQEARRVLVPGGLLILETPNPENLTVGTCSFYMDPTHVNPLPPPLLQFLPDHYGYIRSTILRLQEPAPMPNIDQVTLTQVFRGVSADYAVVAQTPLDGTPGPQLDALFNNDVGVTLDGIANVFDSKINEIQAQSWAANHAVNLLQESTSSTHMTLKIQLSSLELENRTLRTENATLRKEFADQQRLIAHVAWQSNHQDGQIQELAARLAASTGRMHALSTLIPARVVSAAHYMVAQKNMLARDGVKARAKSAARKVVFTSVRKLSRYEKARTVGIFVLKKVGGYEFLRDRLVMRNIPLFHPVVDTTINIDANNLSPHARTVLAKLKLAEKTRGGN
jgi:SAM-dependent methyltransferase